MADDSLASLSSLFIITRVVAVGVWITISWLLAQCFKSSSWWIPHRNWMLCVYDEVALLANSFANSTPVTCKFQFLISRMRIVRSIVELFHFLAISIPVPFKLNSFQIQRPQTRQWVKRPGGETCWYLSESLYWEEPLGSTTTIEFRYCPTVITIMITITLIWLVTVCEGHKGIWYVYTDRHADGICRGRLRLYSDVISYFNIELDVKLN